MLATSHLLVTAEVPGGARYLFTGADGALQVANRKVYPVEFQANVRTSVLWPLIVVALGVIAGRIAGWINSPITQSRLAYYRRYILLRDKVRAMTDIPAQLFCTNRLTGILDSIVSADGSNLQAADGTLTKVDQEVDLFNQLEALLGRTRSSNLPAASVTKLVAEIGNARAALFNEDTAAAAAAAKAITQELASLNNVPTASAALAELTPAATGIGTLVTQMTANGVDQSPTLKWKRIAASGLALIAGTGPLPVEAAFWFVRPFLYVTLLVVLALYGVWQNYSGMTGTALTFGSAGVTQYGALFLWGMSSAVINMTLQTISFPSKPGPS